MENLSPARGAEISARTLILGNPGAVYREGKNSGPTQKSVFGLTALDAASLRSAFDILKTAPFETDCPWVSEDARTL